MIRLGESARSAIEVDVLDGRDDDLDPPSYAVLRACYDDGKLTIPADPADALALAEALTDLANACDDRAEHGDDAEERRFARNARTALTTAAGKASAAARKVAA